MTRPDSFHLALAAHAITALLLVLLIAIVLCVPWRSNVMVFQLPEKKAPAVPVIQVPKEAM